MKYDPQKHHRRSIRLKGYDYTSLGAYFITICTHQRHYLFGEIIDGEMRLNQMGQSVQAHWNRLPTHFPHLKIDAFVIMPNHIHGILTLTPTETPTPRRGAALGNHRSHPTDTVCPNATPGSDSPRSHPTDTLCPNATPGSDSRDRTPPTPFAPMPRPVRIRSNPNPKRHPLVQIKGRSHCLWNPNRA